jgi:dihydrofolate reductase
MTIKCSVYCGASLDGFIAGPDGDIEWLHRPEYATADATGVSYEAFTSSVDTVVMGRHTFEKVLTFGGDWPYDLPVVVLSTTLEAVPEELRGRVRREAGAPLDVVRTLASDGARHLYVDGGVTIQRFLRARLIHEITVTYLPLLLGAGISLFGSTGVETRLELLQATSGDNGFVQVRYAVTDALQPPLGTDGAGAPRSGRPA